MNGGGARKRETQNPKQVPGSELLAESLTWGLSLEMARSWPRPKSDTQPTEPPRCPIPQIFFNVYLFILRQLGGAERGRERIPSRLCANSTGPAASGSLSPSFCPSPPLSQKEALKKINKK